ncbi:SAC3/GANP/Nin1/mts3/eIF-3 p25 family-domain-containing protein [Entophlyctis helioformis]|nr:SAC3/GANP/Nin1/mts3/eIF-3 p25 family-domain-containing protein [Entophlyctis helioformis]
MASLSIKATAPSKPAYMAVRSQQPQTAATTKSAKSTNMDVSPSRAASPVVDAKPSVTDWPESLANYCRRVMDKVSPEKEAAVNKRLKAIILKARKSNALWTTDWDQMPLPAADDSSEVHLLQLSAASKKRKAAATAAAASGKGMAGKLGNGKGAGKGAAGTSDAVDGVGWSFDATRKPLLPPDQSLAHLPPSLRAAEIERRDERLKRFKAREDEEARDRARREREVEEARRANLRSLADGEENPDVADWDENTIVGTCTKLEKSYLRLTSAPDPSTVRPLHILRQTLEMLKGKWKDEHNYTYVCDQFKSLRQDLTVQRIKNEFTVQGDLGEYNQCQAQLKQLYKIYNIAGNTDEFVAYRILYMLHTTNRRDIINTVAELTPEEKRGECVQHALAVRSSMTTSDYQSFFTLYQEAPKMSGYLMDKFIDRERQVALRILLRAFRPTLRVEYIAVVLGFIPRDLVPAIMSWGPDPGAAAVAGALGAASNAKGAGEKDGAGERGVVTVSKEDAKLLRSLVKVAMDWLKAMGVVLVPEPAGAAGAAGAGHADRAQTPVIDTRASLPAVVEQVRLTVSKGVDLKGQIH